MKKCLSSKDIPREVKAMLPAIDSEMYVERACSFCTYHAGLFEKKHRCMMKTCSWDTEEEKFHPVLLQLKEKFDREVARTEEKLRAAKNCQDAINAMFEKEIAERERRKDPCYECTYSKGAPCIGICYKQLLGGTSS